MTPDFLLSPNFTLGELMRSDTADRKNIKNLLPDDPNKATEIINSLKRVCEEILEPCRRHYSRPIRPTSGYRSIRVNRLIGGSNKSQHTQGEAVDFEIPGVSNYHLALFIKNNLRFDQLILEFYRSGVPSSGWVHCSVKDDKLNRYQVLTMSPQTGIKLGLIQ